MIPSRSMVDKQFVVLFLFIRYSFIKVLCDDLLIHGSLDNVPSLILVSSIISAEDIISPMVSSELQSEIINKQNINLDIIVSEEKLSSHPITNNKHVDDSSFIIINKTSNSTSYIPIVKSVLIYPTTIPPSVIGSIISQNVSNINTLPGSSFIQNTSINTHQNYLISTNTLLDTIGDTVTKVYKENFNTPSQLSHEKEISLVEQFAANFNDTKNSDKCHRKAPCVALEKDATCFGVKLPYTHTSLSLTGLPSLAAAKEQLETWSNLKNIPRCWQTVQPFLCAVFFPQCNDSTIQLPAQEMCVVTRAPCRLVEQERGWPEYLKCKEDHPVKCKTASRELKFNTTGVCVPPLVATEREAAWYEGVKDCGVQCVDPSFTPEEHDDIRWFIATLGGICLAFVVLTVLTYFIDWRSASKYPALIVFYVNGCYLVACVGFLVQFNPGVREEITCQTDGTLRQAEPSSDGTLSCVVVFVCIYYFMIAGGMWLIILAYAWHTSFKSLAAGDSQHELERRSAYFHLLAWSIPLVLTITIMAMAEVRADSVTGICFLSPDIYIRVWFLLVPMTLIICISGYFLITGLLILVQLKMDCSNIISDHANSKIVETIIRLSIFMLSLATFTAITIYCHVYHHQNHEAWAKALRDYILCVSKIKSVDPWVESTWSGCVIAERPSINVYKLHLLALFGSGIIMSSWCWTTNSLQAWKRFFKRVAGVEVVDPPGAGQLTKHRVIAQAFAKRHHLHTTGRLSISLRSTHDDPLGLHFDMNSGTSGDLSSLFAAALPHLMTRRGAVVGSTALGLRRNSIDSEYSISRRFSFESGYNNKGSRRHSLDSQMSFHVSDVERMAALHTAARFGRRKRRDWPSVKRSRRIQPWDRRSSRGSNTSDDSNQSSMIMSGLPLDNNDSLFTNMMKRLNLSSDEPSRSERGATSPTAVTATTINLIDTLPVKKLSPPNDVGVENGGYAEEDSVVRGALHIALKSAEKNRHENFMNATAAALKDIHIGGRRNAIHVDTSVMTDSVSIGVQTDKSVMVDKACQVSTPMLIRAAEEHSTINREITIDKPIGPSKGISETSFINKHIGLNSENDGKASPGTALSNKTLNVVNKIDDHLLNGKARNVNFNKRSKYNRTSRCRSIHNRSESEMTCTTTVLDISDSDD